MTTEKPSPPKQIADLCVMVVFGIGGDLFKRLLYPAICNLGSSGLLNEHFTIVGLASSPFNTQSFREQLKKNVKTFIQDPDAQAYGLQLADRVTYLQGNFTDPKSFQQLAKTLVPIQKKLNNYNCMFYFAAPTQFMLDIATGLSQAGLLDEDNGQRFRRIVVEKPFGHDFASAKALNQGLLALVTENQIYRIDHFLGKETVQNILALRFSNGLFEPIWNYLYIDHVQISAAESLGVEMRGGYYESAGALRDMIPNHLFQILGLVAMEPPSSFESRHIQDEKIKALQAIRVPRPDEVPKIAVRGQYGAGTIDGKAVPAYRSEARIAPDSATETFAAIKLSIDNWRWLNVPFYLRTGKRMKTRTTEVIIQFKSGPSTLFSNCHEQIKPDILRIHIQPDEGISLRFNAKVPGTTMQLEPVEMSYKYNDYFSSRKQTGYETILYECMNGDHLLFKRAETVEAGWAVVQPILNAWGRKKPSEFPNYDAGSWGPKEADMLIHRDGRKWIP